MVAIGILLLVAGVVLFFVEAHVPTHGVLGAGALAALVAGVVLLVLAADASLAVGLAIGFVLAGVGSAFPSCLPPLAQGGRRAQAGEAEGGQGVPARHGEAGEHPGGLVAGRRADLGAVQQVLHGRGADATGPATGWSWRGCTG